jgi:NADH-quinone oxidoreductase subunit M
MVEKHAGSAPASYHMGVDGISMLFVILTTFLMPFCILASWDSRSTKRVKEYMIAFLILETLMIGVFVALDIVLFYVFFEAGLIPMFLIIGVWGGKRRVYASYKFFLYTLLGSVLMLLAIMAMYWQAGTTDIPTLLPTSSRRHADMAMAGLLRLLRGEDADVAGPYLAARRARRGADGGLGHPGRRPAEDGRLRLPALLAADVPDGVANISRRFVFALSVVAIIYTSLVALMQEDIKKLIAYSSVAHMGFVTMGIFAANAGRAGRDLPDAVARHRLRRALPLRRRRLRPHAHPRDRAYGGLVNNMPKYAVAFMVFTMANVGLPGTSGFVGEFLTLIGVLPGQHLGRVLRATGVILSAAYALWLYRRVIFGALTKEAEGHARPQRREKVILYPLIVLTIFFGVYPAPVFDATPPRSSARQQYHCRIARRADGALAN